MSRTTQAQPWVCRTRHTQPKPVLEHRDVATTRRRRLAARDDCPSEAAALALSLRPLSRSAGMKAACESHARRVPWGLRSQAPAELCPNGPYVVFRQTPLGSFRASPANREPPAGPRTLPSMGSHLFPRFTLRYQFRGPRCDTGGHRTPKFSTALRAAGTQAPAAARNPTVCARKLDRRYGILYKIRSCKVF